LGINGAGGAKFSCLLVILLKWDRIAIKTRSTSNHSQTNNNMVRTRLVAMEFYDENPFQRIRAS
jgi:hypothetical protein